METDKVRAKLSYSPITKKMTLYRHRVHHALPQCDGNHVRIPSFGGPQSSGSNMSTSSRDTYVHPSLVGTDIGLTPSASVVLQAKQIPGDPDSFSPISPISW